MKATSILRSEHEVILDVLSALESISRPALAGGELDRSSARQVLDFLRGFCDRCHHGKEEQILFPALAEAGLPLEVGPLAVMASDHAEGRSLIAAMGQALEDAVQSQAGADVRFGSAAAQYVALMREHIDKENGVLFPMGDGMFPDAKQAALVRAMERFEHADIEEGAHERFLGVAGELVERFGVERAARAPASTHHCCGHGKRCA